jgi:hypothetical protein
MVRYRINLIPMFISLVIFEWFVLRPGSISDPAKPYGTGTVTIWEIEVRKITLRAGVYWFRVE